VPAAAVIPAPIAYIKVVAVKRLVVECMFCVHLAHFCIYCGNDCADVQQTFSLAKEILLPLIGLAVYYLVLLL